LRPDPGKKGANINGHQFLSVVVIGRNEARHLPELFASLPQGEEIEWIYVDSHSEDSSVEEALKAGARVYQLEESAVCGPGTGRHVGTREASGRWILYLDGDMVFRKEFLPFLRLIQEKDAAAPAHTAGFVGRTRHRYLDENGEVAGERDYAVLPARAMGPPEQWGRPASYHGGAVLYLRKRILEAGNWNPALYQLEEVDLLSRVQDRGGVLRAVDLPLADHYAPLLSGWEKIKLNFLPQWRGKKLYGAGQVVTARIREGGLGRFIRSYPYPFVVLVGLAAIPICYLLWPPLPLLVNAAIAVWLGLLQRWYFYLVYLGNLLQIFYGLGRYRRFEPVYRRVDRQFNR